MKKKSYYLGENKKKSAIKIFTVTIMILLIATAFSPSINSEIIDEKETKNKYELRLTNVNTHGILSSLLQKIIDIFPVLESIPFIQKLLDILNPKCGPEIGLEKEADVESAYVGDTITYTYTVTNTGDVYLVDITVVDDILGDVTLDTTTLDPSESTNGVLTYTIQESDLPGPIINTAIARGIVCGAEYVEDSDSESVIILSDTEISIDLEKEADVESAYVGDTITYTYTVTNTGDETLYGIFIIDDLLGSVSLNATTLEPGEWAVGTLTYTVQESDLPGPIINVAIVNGHTFCEVIVTDTAEETVDILNYEASISIIKEADRDIAEVGDTITYAYTVKNDGDVTLYNVIVIDDLLGPVSLNDTTLSPGEWAVGVLTYTVQESDLPGPIINIATATGSPCSGDDVTDASKESVRLEYGQASINIIKEADRDIAEVGDTITYTYTVTNDGDVNLYDVFVVDNLLGSVSLNATTLEPGEWAVGVLTYTVQESDLPGPIINIATATGSPCQGEDVRDEAHESVDLEIPCQPEVWVDDSWYGQGNVNAFNPSLIWQYNAFNKIQDAVDVVCDCGTIHVRAGIYLEQILIDKSLSLLGESGAKLFASNLDGFTIDGSVETYKPMIFAFGGTLIGNNVVSSGNIGVTIDGFEMNGGDIPDAIAILYHNVETGCSPSMITNNEIEEFDYGIHINGCSEDTTIEWNRITWPSHTMDKVAIIITGSGDCEPDNVEIHHNFIGVECGWNIGVWNQVGNIPDATFNWWGAPDGPAGPEGSKNYDAITGRVADGFGDRVIGLVHFDPWAGVESSGEVTEAGFGDPPMLKYDASDSFAYHLDGTPIDNIEYQWDFGDGRYSFSKLIYRHPIRNGPYTVSLRVKAADSDLLPGRFMYDWSEYTGYYYGN